MILLLVLAVSATVRGETQITEKPDQILIEIIGAPPTQEELAMRERQQRRSELESAIRQLLTEREELAKKGVQEGSSETAQERRARLVENRRDMDRLQDELRELNYQLGNDQSRN
jgi:hypothetical protein